MKKSLIALAVLAMAAASKTVVRARTHDIAFTFRMGAGFPGDVNRTHPASIVPCLQDPNEPVLHYGDPCVVDATDNTVRAVNITDDAITTVYGFLVRPYPTQQTTDGMTASIGAATPPTSGVVDVLRQGFIMVHLPDFAAASPVKGGAVSVWTAAASGNHLPGTLEAAITGGSSTGAIANARFNGPPDASGVTELEVWAA